MAQVPFCSSLATGEGQAEVVICHLLPPKGPQDFRTGKLQISCSASMARRQLTVVCGKRRGEEAG